MMGRCINFKLVTFACLFVTSFVKSERSSNGDDESEEEYYEDGDYYENDDEGHYNYDEDEDDEDDENDDDDGDDEDDDDENDEDNGDDRKNYDHLERVITKDAIPKVHIENADEKTRRMDGVAVSAAVVRPSVNVNTTNIEPWNMDVLIDMKEVEPNGFGDENKEQIIIDKLLPKIDENLEGEITQRGMQDSSSGKEMQEGKRKTGRKARKLKNKIRGRKAKQQQESRNYMNKVRHKKEKKKKESSPKNEIQSEKKFENSVITVNKKENETTREITMLENMNEKYRGYTLLAAVVTSFLTFMVFIFCACLLSCTRQQCLVFCFDCVICFSCGITRRRRDSATLSAVCRYLNVKRPNRPRVVSDELLKEIVDAPKIRRGEITAVEEA